MDTVIQDLAAIEQDRKNYRNSQYYVEATNDKNIIQVHRELRIKKPVGQHIPRKFLGEHWQTALIDAQFEYRPDKNTITFIENHTHKFNTYIPPTHLEDSYWSGEKFNITKRHFSDETYNKEVPDCYTQFFKHLTGGHEESFHYILDWLSTALDIQSGGRNLTSLVMVSTPGLGKGVFFSNIVTPLFGAANTHLASGQNLFVNQFNSIFADKQVVMLDEIELKDSETINRFKTLVNDEIEIEKKGKDKYTTKNFLNLILCSNDLNCIRIDEGDRRFSVINTNNNRVMLGDAVGSVPNFISKLTNKENIAKFYNWLIQHQPARDMNKPFKGAKLDEIKDAGLNTWERAFLEHCTEMFTSKGSEVVIPQRDFKSVFDKLNMQNHPGATKLQALSKRFPSVFSLVGARINKVQTKCIKIIGAYDTSQFDRIEALDIDLPETTKPYLAKIGLK